MHFASDPIDRVAGDTASEAAIVLFAYIRAYVPTYFLLRTCLFLYYIFNEAVLKLYSI
jgi:hypothetical protein